MSWDRLSLRSREAGAQTLVALDNSQASPTEQAHPGACRCGQGNVVVALLSGSS